MKTYFIDLNTRCTVCDRKVSVVQEWVPTPTGIRHARCQPEPVIDGEWVTEWLCSSCGTPTDPGAQCSYCDRPTRISQHREWRCLVHGGACFCFPAEAGTDEVPW